MQMCNSSMRAQTNLAEGGNMFNSKYMPSALAWTFMVVTCSILWPRSLFTTLIMRRYAVSESRQIPTYIFTDNCDIFGICDYSASIGVSWNCYLTWQRCIIYNVLECLFPTFTRMANITCINLLLLLLLLLIIIIIIIFFFLIIIIIRRLCLTWYSCASCPASSLSDKCRFWCYPTTPTSVYLSLFHRHLHHDHSHVHILFYSSQYMPIPL